MIIKENEYAKRIAEICDGDNEDTSVREAFSIEYMRYLFNLSEGRNMFANR